MPNQGLHRPGGGAGGGGGGVGSGPGMGDALWLPLMLKALPSLLGAFIAAP